MFGKLTKIFDKSGLDSGSTFITNGGPIDDRPHGPHLDALHRGVTERGSTIAEFQATEVRRHGVHNDAVDRGGQK